jgi:hypothetical protein
MEVKRIEMWKPEKPIVIAGYTLSTEEAWLRCFTHEYSRLVRGDDALEHLADWAIELYPGNADRDPVEVAREEYDKAD